MTVPVAPERLDPIVDPRTRFQWVEAAGRYRGPGGKFVARSAIRSAIDDTLLVSERRVRALAESLRADRITLDTWAREMRREIKRVHLWNAAGARGGWAQMTPADYGRVGAIVKRQYKYLYRFAGEIERGLVIDGGTVARAVLYGKAGTSTFEHFHFLEAKEHGHTEERNVLGSAEHCEGANSCIEASGRGWVPIGTLPRPGARKCRGGCKCRMEYR